MNAYVVLSIRDLNRMLRAAKAKRAADAARRIAARAAGLSALNTNTLNPANYTIVIENIRVEPCGVNHQIFSADLSNPKNII